MITNTSNKLITDCITKKITSTYAVTSSILKNLWCPETQVNASIIATLEETTQDGSSADQKITLKIKVDGDTDYSKTYDLKLGQTISLTICDFRELALETFGTQGSVALNTQICLSYVYEQSDNALGFANCDCSLNKDPVTCSNQFKTTHTLVPSVDQTVWVAENHDYNGGILALEATANTLQKDDGGTSVSAITTCKIVYKDAHEELVTFPSTVNTPLLVAFENVEQVLLTSDAETGEATITTEFSLSYWKLECD